MRGSNKTLRRVITTAIFCLAVGSIGAPIAIAKGPGGGTACSKRNPCDTTPPAVSISAPSAGSSVQGSINVTGTASDNKAVSAVQVKVDSGSAAPASGTSSWTEAIDTKTLANGSHQITATATDAAGNVGTSSVTVTVSNSDPSPSPSPSPSSSQTPVAAPNLAPGTIGGFVFQESDRDGVFESDEQPLANMIIYLYTGSGTYIKNTSTGSNGWYQLTGLGDGSYRAMIAPTSWFPIRSYWVPDTAAIDATSNVQLAGSARSDFGLRQIVRSTNASSPISQLTASSGLVVQSFDDVVDANTIYNALLQGSLVGSEQSNVTIRFDFTSGGSTSTMASQSNGVYTYFHATSNIPYINWLDSGDTTLFHEYGHAWSLYYAYMVQQDATLTSYLKARGVYGDVRVGSSYMWDAKEMIAEDYRQLFGTANAASGAQMNTDLPRASDVPGLKDFLQTTFRSAP